MKKISIYNSFIKDNNNKREILAKKLKSHGFSTSKDGELLIVIGGDGTFLSAIRKRLDQNPIFVGFNTGNLGFLSEFTLDNTNEFINMLKREEYVIETLPVYEVILKENGEKKVEYFVNDLVVERKGTRILHMSVHINETNLCSISGDGLIISTALGSTGYGMSTGGAVSMDVKDILQVSPVSPVYSRAYQSLSSPLLLNDSNEITIFPNYKKQRTFRVVCDGREIKTRNSRIIEVRKSEKTVRILRSKKYNNLDNIKNKILKPE